MRPKRRVTLLHNRTAGEADHDRQELVAAIEAHGYKVTYFEAKGADISKALAKSADLIAVAGGDGTVRKIALAAAPEGPPIAILPFGTANNIANSLRITASLKDSIAGWADPHLVKFHPIEVDAPWGRQRLIEGIGFGVFARTIKESAGDDKPSPLEAREQMAEMLREAKAEALDIRVDGARLSGDIVLLEITTIPLVGPNLYLAPEANPSDRLVDLCSVAAGEEAALAEWLEAPKSGEPAPVATRAGSHITISGRFECIRLDDDVRTFNSADAATITLSSATEGVYFVVPPD
jgi:diacylglycerol kinase (ATP)